jgi:hypothetical protein
MMLAILLMGKHQFRVSLDTKSETESVAEPFVSIQNVGGDMGAGYIRNGLTL